MVHWTERHGCGVKGRDAIGREVKDGRHREVGSWHLAQLGVAGGQGSWKKVSEGTKQRVLLWKKGGLKNERMDDLVTRVADEPSRLKPKARARI
jgi:hypothetical protein